MSTNNKEVKTTGHVWDEDLQEYNNPLPRWWLWTFYATIIFSIIYWIMYPTFPMGKGFNTGLNTITYKDSHGIEHTTPWNTRYLLEKEMHNSSSALRQKEYLDKVAKASYEDIVNDQEMMDFTRSYAKVVFGDNCSTCHQVGGAGVPQLYPNLTDDSWLFGGTFDHINQSIAQGRTGIMPEHGSRFSDQQIQEIATYVIGLTDESVDQTLAEKGKISFMGAAACFACHGSNSEGNSMIGGPALKDQIWTIANINQGTTTADKISMVASIIKNGATRKMPPWKDRLSPADIKALTVYVHELGGGQ